MAFLLTTKLIPPKLPQVFVNRPRLNQMIDEWQYSQLTLITAPAGYGKTMLVTNWLQQENVSCAWLSLDEFDDDPVRFLRYFIAAWQTIDPEIGKASQDILDGNTTGLLASAPQSLLIPIINDLAQRSSKDVLVLDDFHEISNPIICNMLNFWVDNAPSHTHTIMTTRHGPELQLSRWRVRRQLIEIGSADLQFTTKEAISFLKDGMQLPVTDENIQQLMNQTEGWAASLQLVALSLQGSSEPEKMLERFSSNHRFIVDYLVDEVLSRESAEIQAFLRDTSILTRLTPSICNTITGRTDSQQTLVTLDRRNLFISAVDLSQTTFRYHPLFADTLRKQLEATSADRVKQLHHSAFQWLVSQGNMEESIKHGLAAEKFDEVAKLLNKYADAAVWRNNQAYKVIEWCQLLPFEALNQYPRLMLDYGWAMLMGGARDQIVDYAEKIHPYIQDTNIESYKIEFDTLKTEGSILQDDLNDALEKLNSIDYIGLRSASSYAVIS
ncbi:MAG: AAA family ATPase, partial [Chloroflexota bacterium]